MRQPKVYNSLIDKCQNIWVSSLRSLFGNLFFDPVELAMVSSCDGPVPHANLQPKTGATASCALYIFKKYLFLVLPLQFTIQTQQSITAAVSSSVLFWGYILVFLFFFSFSLLKLASVQNEDIFWGKVGSLSLGKARYNSANMTMCSILKQ